MNDSSSPTRWTFSFLDTCNNQEPGAFFCFFARVHVWESWASLLWLPHRTLVLAVVILVIMLIEAEKKLQTVRAVYFSSLSAVELWLTSRGISLSSWFVFLTSRCSGLGSLPLVLLKTPRWDVSEMLGDVVWYETNRCQEEMTFFFFIIIFFFWTIMNRKARGGRAGRTSRKPALAAFPVSLLLPPNPHCNSSAPQQVAQKEVWHIFFRQIFGVSILVTSLT